MKRARIGLLIVNVPATQWHGEVGEDKRLIGRSRRADISIPSRFSQVSRFHAEVWADAERIEIRDIGSSGGTRLNGVPLQTGKITEVRLGDRLWLGGLELIVVSTLDVAADSPSGNPVISSAGGRRRPQTPLEATVRPAELPLEVLTSAELAIVRWMTRGVTDLNALGRTLFRSPHTVRTQLNNIYSKLAVHSKDELLGRLMQIGHHGEN